MIRRLFRALAVLSLLLVGCENQLPREQRGCARPKVIAFTATWCDPCKQAKPFLVQMEAAGIDVQVVDIDENPDTARRFGVTSVPTFFVYVCGKKTVRTQDITVVVALTRFGCR